jgi:nicotinamide riboside transporter PnuC
MIKIIGTIATCLAVAGVWLNNRKRLACFYLWLVSNFLCAIIHSSTGIWSLFFRDVIFIILAVEGLIKWSRK